MFEAFLHRYRLDDPALQWIAQLVREADLEDELYDAPEAARLDTIVRGLSLICDDETLIASTAPLFDGL